MARVREQALQIVILLQQPCVFLLELADFSEGRGEYGHRVLEVELPERGLQFCYGLFELRT